VLETTETTRGAAEVIRAIRERRSIGRMTAEMPPRALIEELLEAASWAPCHHVTEPWRFAVVTGEARKALGEVMARSKIDRMKAQGKPVDGEFERVAAKALRAPVIIAIAVEPQLGPKVREFEELLAGAAAVQNLLLAAHAHGLAAIWRTGDPAYDPRVREHLGFGERATLLGFVYLGYADAAPSRDRHTPAAQLTRWLD
jgi:nitroreductase